MAEINMDMKIEMKLNPKWMEFQAEVTKAIEIAARNVEKGGKEKVPVDTGFTKGSITATPVGGFIRGQNIEWSIGPTSEYALALEFGTWKMDARPFMTNTLEEERPRIENAIKQLMDKLR